MRSCSVHAQPLHCLYIFAKDLICRTNRTFLAAQVVHATARFRPQGNVHTFEKCLNAFVKYQTLLMGLDQIV